MENECADGNCRMYVCTSAGLNLEHQEHLSWPGLLEVYMLMVQHCLDTCGNAHMLLEGSLMSCPIGRWISCVHYAHLDRVDMLLEGSPVSCLISR